MSEAALEAVLRRDRFVVLAALAALALLAWSYLAWLAADMDMHAMAPSPEGGGAMPGMAAHAPASAVEPGLRPWAAADFLLMFAMWAVMMIGMMAPAASPMILLYARVARQARDRGTPFAPAGWFGGGYLLAWTGFAAAATLLQWALEQAALLTTGMASASRWFGAGLLVAAGLYQWTPLKDACLRQCRAPLAFVQTHGGFRSDPRGATRLGLLHGAYCIGCCWSLMLLLFLGGVMNLLWIAGLAMLVLAEKVVPGGRMLSRTAGLALIAAGAMLAARAI